MSRLKFILLLAALTIACSAASGPLPSQAMASGTKPIVLAAAAKKKQAEPSVWDQTKTMTRRQWDGAKRKWASEKVKWRDCNREARARKLRGTESWTHVGRCMTK